VCTRSRSRIGGNHLPRCVIPSGTYRHVARTAARRTRQRVYALDRYRTLARWYRRTRTQTAATGRLWCSAVVDDAVAPTAADGGARVHADGRRRLDRRPRIGHHPGVRVHGKLLSGASMRRDATKRPQRHRITEKIKNNHYNNNRMCVSAPSFSFSLILWPVRDGRRVTFLW